MAYLFIAPSSNAQQTDAETGNIIYTNLNPSPTGTPYSWTGFVNTTSTGAGYTGGNVPAYNPSTGTFIFGYSQGTIRYAVAVNAAMQAAGTGIQINGFKYSWNYLNQDFSRGTLTGNISLTNSGGSVVESYNYNMPKTTEGWTLMSGIQNFTNQYALTSLGNLNVSFTGKDDRFWAGYYGPQIKNIDVRMLYSSSPPPPHTEPTTNTSCTAYSVDPKCISQTSTPTTTTTSTPTTTEPVASTSVYTTPITTVSPVIETVSPATTQTSSSTTSTPVATTQSTSTSSAPSATNPQPKVGEVTVSGSPAKTTMSSSQVLAIVKSEQTRIGNLETSTAQQAVEQAQAAGDKAQQESISVSASTVSQSQASAQAAVSMTSASSTVNNNQITNQGSTSVSVIVNQSSTARSQNIYSLVPPTPAQSTTQIASMSSQVFYSINKNETFKSQEEPPKMEGIKFNSTNPIFNIINSPAPSQSSTQENQTTATVNTKVKDNDAAGGVSLDMIAKQPKGFETYMTIVPDVAFYAPKDIYKGQVTVDNVRALRQLSSDRLHREMVEQQYRK